MARTTINELKRRRLAGAARPNSASFDETYAASALAVRVDEQIRDARRSAERNQPGTARP